MKEIFEKSDEWGGYTIEAGVTGFIVEYHTHMEGERDGVRILVPYGTWGFHSGTALDAPHDEVATNGEALADLAMADARCRFEERQVELLSAGVVLGMAEPAAARSTAAEGWDQEAQGEDSGGETAPYAWYTFSLKKEDEGGYGACHDLFTTMYLTHGLPHGMALWTRSDYATDQNIFFAQIPAGMMVEGDEFFRTFPLARCEAPWHDDLTMLVGHLEEAAQIHPPAKRRRRWRSSAASRFRKAV
jgi:hypothetical protein